MIYHFHVKKAWSFILVENMCIAYQSKSENGNINQIKLENIVLEEPMRIALNVNGCNKLGQNRFDNIVAMKINVILGFSISISFSADTNMEKRYQPEQLQILSKTLIKAAK